MVAAGAARRRVDLNADVGEGGAGDAGTMAAACAAAARNGVALGAHPGFADRVGFGRREQVIGLAELGILLGDQTRALRAVADAAGVPIRHVKPHGALYHFLNREAAHALLFAETWRALAPGAALVGPPAGALREAAKIAGVRHVAEGFIDRAYRADGSLVPRGEPGAVLHEVAEAVAQALALARAGRVETLCVHGDGPDAVDLLKAARAALVAEGFGICAPEWGPEGEPGR